MAARIDQAAVVVLAVNFDKRRGDFAQQRHADRLIVEKGLRSAVRLELALEDQRFAGLDLQFGILDDAAHRLWKRSEFEAGRHACPAFAGAHESAVGPIAEHQPERVEQDRFTRTGLAGEDAEAPGKLQVERLDQDDVSDGKSGQHVREAF